MLQRVRPMCDPLRWTAVVLLYTAFLTSPSSCGLGQHELFTYLLDRDGSQHSIIERPVERDNESVPVTIGFNLQQIIALDVKEQYLLSSLWLELNWRDATLQWDPLNFGNITTIRLPIKVIWRPDILLYNTADDKYDGTWPVNAIIRYDGSVSYVPPTMLRSTCKVNVKWFPFDEQLCMLKFGSWTYHDREVNLTLQTSPTKVNDDMTNGEFDIENIDARRFDNVYEYGEGYAENYPFISLCIHLKRRDLFYFFNLIIPSILIMTVALLVFFLPAESGEKMGLSVTVLLSLTVYSTVLSETMPRTSDAVPLLGIYCQIIMILCAIAVSTQVWSLHIHYSDSPSPWMHWVCTRLAKFVGMKTPDNILHPRESECTQNDCTHHKPAQQSKHYLPVRGVDVSTESDVQEITNDTIQIARSTNSTSNDCTCNQSPGDANLDRSHSLGADEAFRRRLGNQLVDVTNKLEVLADRIRGKNDADYEASICCFASVVIDRTCLYLYCLCAFVLTLLICIWRPDTTEVGGGQPLCGDGGA